jgi:hypothetical protein
MPAQVLGLVVGRLYGQSMQSTRRYEASAALEYGSLDSTCPTASSPVLGMTGTLLLLSGTVCGRSYQVLYVAGTAINTTHAAGVMMQADT